jgi:uroporphyrinogen decarboxylase
MTGRERVIAAVEFKGPDRIPHKHCFLPAAFIRYPRLSELYRRFPSDYAGEDGSAPRPNREHSVGEYVDEWQCTWTVLQEGCIGQVTRHPLTDLGHLSKYRFPDVQPWAVDRSGPPDDRYRGSPGLTLYERMIDLCGFENLHTELAAGNPDILTIRDRVVDYNVAAVREYLKSDPDSICFADDWGTQLALTISPSLWREVFLPAYHRQFAPALEAGKHIFFHSDGVTIEILPHLVNAGVNIFWVDLTLNSLDRLHCELGGKVCFMGLTDVQFTLRNGTPDQVRRHGKDLIGALGCFNGGFIACSEVEPDQPWENIEAILETFHDHASYPLRLRWDADKRRAVEITE